MKLRQTFSGKFWQIESEESFQDLADRQASAGNRLGSDSLCLYLHLVFSQLFIWEVEWVTMGMVMNDGYSVILSFFFLLYTK